MAKLTSRKKECPVCGVRKHLHPHVQQKAKYDEEHELLMELGVEEYKQRSQSNDGGYVGDNSPFSDDEDGRASGRVSEEDAKVKVLNHGNKNDGDGKSGGLSLPDGWERIKDADYPDEETAKKAVLAKRKGYNFINPEEGEVARTRDDINE